jgi:hypothetical protein
MKLPIAILALACSIAGLHSAACAQGDNSRTYTGTNGPRSQRTGVADVPGGLGEDFVANIYGSDDEFAIEVKSPGTCNRPFYLTGTVSFQPNQSRGTIGGPMLRCTNPELKAACAKVGITLTDYYEVGYTGTIERNPGNSLFLIKITYPYVIWVKEDCTEKRETQGRDIIRLTYRPRAPPPPTNRELYDRAWDKSTDTVYKSVRGGRWLQNQR